MLAFTRTSLLLLGLLPLCLVLPVLAHGEQQHASSMTRSVAFKKGAATGSAGEVGGSSASGLGASVVRRSSALSWDKVRLSPRLPYLQAVRR